MRKIFKKLGTALVCGLMAATLALPATAFAGTAGSNGGLGSYWAGSIRKSDVNGAINNLGWTFSSDADRIKNTIGVDSCLAAWLTCGGGKFASDYFRWDAFFGKLTVIGTLEVNTGSKFSNLRSQIVNTNPLIANEVWNNTYLGTVSKDRYRNFDWYIRNADGNPLDAVWVEEKRVPRDEVKTFLKVGKKDGDPIVDHTPEYSTEPGRKQIYWNGVSNSEYEHTFNDQSSTNIETVYSPIIRSYTEVQKLDPNGNWYVDHIEDEKYTEGAPTPVTRKITYNVQAPTITQQYFRPFNLNTNDYAEDDLVKTTFSSAYNPTGDLLGFVDDEQGGEGMHIQSVDTNQKVMFRFQLATDQFGIPHKSDGGFNVDTSVGNYTGQPEAVRDMEDTTYEQTGTLTSSMVSGPGSTMSPMAIQGWVTRDLYGSQVLQYGISGGDSTSIQVDPSNDNHETVVNAQLANNPAGSGGNHFNVANGVECYFRSIQRGSYHLQSNASPNWWVTQYEQAKHYTVGVTVKGTIAGTLTSDPISQPTAPNAGQLVLGKSNHTVRVQKYLQDQPVLYGKFDVKSVAGQVE